MVWGGGFTRINAVSGATVGGAVPFGVYTAASMVYNTQDKRYAVAHAHSTGSALYFAFLDASGKSVGSSTVYTATTGYKISNNGGNEAMALGYSPTHNEYGVAFRLKPTSGGTGYTASILFLQVNKNGWAPSKVTAVSQAELGLLEPLLQWNGYAWGLTFTYHAPKMSTRVMQLSRTGMPVSKTVTVNCPATAQRIYPDLAWNGSRWAVLWNEGKQQHVFAGFWKP